MPGPSTSIPVTPAALSYLQWASGQLWCAHSVTAQSPRKAKSQISAVQFHSQTAVTQLTVSTKEHCINVVISFSHAALPASPDLPAGSCACAGPRSPFLSIPSGRSQVGSRSPVKFCFPACFVIQIVFWSTWLAQHIFTTPSSLQTNSLFSNFWQS